MNAYRDTARVLPVDRAMDKPPLEESLGGAALPKAATEASTIALFGLFGCGNLGNDGSLEAMIGFLRGARPNAKLYCVCTDPDVIGRTMGIEAIPMRWSRGLRRRSVFSRVLLWGPLKFIDFAKAAQFISRADVMLIPGTGILDDFGERAYGMPLDILVWCLAARLMGTRLAFVCIGAGPIRHRISRWLMTFSARLAHYRSYRDAMSKEFMANNAGFETTGDPVYPDIAFKLPAPAARTVNRADDRLTIGVGVMSYYGWYGFADGGQQIFDRYIEKLSRFVVHVLDSGHAVRLLTGEIGDRIAVDALLANVRAIRPGLSATAIVAEPSASLHEVMDQMADTDIVVATRFHNIVCALKMGKPTISLAYSKKNDVLMGQMGLEDYCQHVEHFDVTKLIGQLDSLVLRRDDHARKIRDQVDKLQQELMRQDEILLSTML
ncbi:polysaccharide pyruvyl transferase family protein [Aminobacter sp. HY435]|uniref:polysaccharide pyruvyl transferase family protein n=1 Tax=Aminobacter sp. HY435 TaxID=2970917 RepID=UPI0022B993CD|nr:polysaccharide pyruvyl transferase family protein [Aminobacter sp. HY435]